MQGPIKILLVDGDATQRMLLTLTLNSLGFPHIAVAIDGEDALSLLKMTKFDLVITEVNMPHLDGFGLLKRMSAFGYLSHTPIIMLTSEVSEKDKLNASCLGASDYLQKPVKEHELRRAIQRA